MLGLTTAAAKRPGEISGVLQERVRIACALCMEPEVLLLDEPSGALDALTRAKLQDELLAIVATTYSTVVMVTHDVDEAVLPSGRIVMLTNGPSATIGDIIEVPQERPRERAEPKIHRMTAAPSPTRAPTSSPLRIISSMATKQILADLTALYTAQTGQAVAVESVGGVDAAKRVQAGEAFDVVILARNAMDKLQTDGKLSTAGKLQAGGIQDLVVSGVAVAVPSGTPHPDIGSEAAVKLAVLNARSLGYSTGPSGVQLAQLFERWGIADQIKSRIVQAPPGVPVGALIAKGEVALGFQQLSEMLNVPGIDMIGMLPPAIEIITTFSGAVARSCNRASEAAALLDFMRTPACADAIRANGMEPTQLPNAS